MGVRWAALNVSGAVQKYARVPGSPLVRNLGWWQAFNGAFAGKLHPINFAQQALIPEFQGATGGAVWMPSDLDWSITNFDEPTNGFSLNCTNGLVNMALGLGTNWVNPGGTAIEPGLSSGGHGISPVEVNPINVMSNAPSGDVHPAQVPGTKYGDWAYMATGIQFASEIAQQACMYNASETTEDFPGLTGPNLCVAALGIARNVRISGVTIPDRSDLLFGSTGVPFLGWYAWYYDGYYGPLHYINSDNIYAVPEMPTATGLYLILKPGVKMDVNMGVNEYQSTATITTLGQIDFVAGIVAGLTQH